MKERLKEIGRLLKTTKPGTQKYAKLMAEIDQICGTRDIENNPCDECDGSGTYYISGEPRDCVCKEDENPMELPCPHSRPDFRVCPHCMGF